MIRISIPEIIGRFFPGFQHSRHAAGSADAGHYLVGHDTVRIRNTNAFVCAQAAVADAILERITVPYQTSLSLPNVPTMYGATLYRAGKDYPQGWLDTLVGNNMGPTFSLPDKRGLICDVRRLGWFELWGEIIMHGNMLCMTQSPVKPEGDQSELKDLTIFPPSVNPSIIRQFDGHYVGPSDTDWFMDSSGFTDAMYHRWPNELNLYFRDGSDSSSTADMIAELVANLEPDIIPAAYGELRGRFLEHLLPLAGNYWPMGGWFLRFLTPYGQNGEYVPRTSRANLVLLSFIRARAAFCTDYWTSALCDFVHAHETTTRTVVYRVHIDGSLETKSDSTSTSTFVSRGLEWSRSVSTSITGDWENGDWYYGRWSAHYWDLVSIWDCGITLAELELRYSELEDEFRSAQSALQQAIDDQDRRLAEFRDAFLETYEVCLEDALSHDDVSEDSGRTYGYYGVSTWMNSERYPTYYPQSITDYGWSPTTDQVWSDILSRIVSSYRAYEGADYYYRPYVGMKHWYLEGSGGTLQIDYVTDYFGPLNAIIGQMLDVIKDVDRLRDAAAAADAKLDMGVAMTIGGFARAMMDAGSFEYDDARIPAGRNEDGSFSDAEVEFTVSTSRTVPVESDDSHAGSTQEVWPAESLVRDGWVRSETCQVAQSCDDDFHAFQANAAGDAYEAKREPAPSVRCRMLVSSSQDVDAGTPQRLMTEIASKSITVHDTIGRHPCPLLPILGPFSTALKESTEDLSPTSPAGILPDETICYYHPEKSPRIGDGESAKILPHLITSAEFGPYDSGYYVDVYYRSEDWYELDTVIVSRDYYDSSKSQYASAPECKESLRSRFSAKAALAAEFSWKCMPVQY